MLKKFIPDILTLSNLSFGILSILEVYEGNYFEAAIFIIIAAIIDRYDGRIARFLNVSSELGKNLDSFADLVSFGVAPVFLIHAKYNFIDLRYMKIFGFCSLILYVLCGAYRLANYNIREFSGIFTGIPITVSGLVIAVFSLIAPYNSVSTPSSIVLLIAFAYLMVSKFKLKKI